MNNPKKISGIICLAISAFCIFVAVERYNNNADKVGAINALQQQHLQQIDEFQQIQFPEDFENQSPINSSAHMVPAVPTITKYAIVIALAFAIAGGVLLISKDKNTAE